MHYTPKARGISDIFRKGVEGLKEEYSADSITIEQVFLQDIPLFFYNFYYHFSSFKTNLNDYKHLFTLYSFDASKKTKSMVTY